MKFSKNCYFECIYSWTYNFIFPQILIAVFAFVYGNPIRLINGYDTFGNTCGVKNNQKFGNMELSGQDTSDKP